MIRVLGEGPKDCQIALIGEAPGRDDETLGRPFIGADGGILNMKLHRVGLARQSLYITYLSKVRPKTWQQVHGGRKPINEYDFSVFWSSKATSARPTPELMQFKDELLLELESVKANVFVALGSAALWALTGEKAIAKWRGSILPCTLPSGRVIKVIGTWHPNAVMRQWALGAVMEFDLQRAVKESNSPEVNRPKRELIIKPTYSDIIDFFKHEEQLDTRKRIMYDIETSPAQGMTCISFAYRKDMAISIPTTKAYWGGWDDWRLVMRKVHEILTKPGYERCAQNASYDIQYLARIYGILPMKSWQDTMIMMHSCYSELRKGLDFITSIFTDEPYYKDDLKVWFEGGYTDDKLYEYNARDSAVQYECMEALDKEMDRLEVRPTYNFMMSLLEPLLYMMLRGVRLNQDKLQYYRTHLLDEWDKRQAEVFKECKVDNPKFINSPKQLIEWMLANKMAPPKKQGRYTTEKTKLQAFYYKYPMLEKVIEARETRKLIGTYLGVDVDTRLPSKPVADQVDGRIRCSYNSTGAETGRLSSSESIFNCGYNLQNVPKKIRDIFVPDPGKVFTEADLKGAEAMIVAYLAREPIQIKVFEEGGNIHTRNAMMIYSHLNVTEEDIKLEKEERGKRDEATKSMYYRAKKVGHSSNYLASKKSLSETLRVSPTDASMLLQRYYAAYPNIRLWHREVEYEIRHTRTLTTPLGRKRIFFGARVVNGALDDQTLREAVAYVPQETSAHVLNLGLINVYNELCSHPEIELLLTVHDSLLVQHPPELSDFVVKELTRLMSIPLTIHGRTLTIPIEIESGKNWKDLAEVEVK